MLFPVYKPLLTLSGTTSRLLLAFLSQQQRSKKWKCKDWGLYGEAEQRADRYEKRLKRRAGNRELKHLLKFSDTFTLPTVRQFEEKVKHTTRGKGLFAKTSGKSSSASQEDQAASGGFSQPGVRSNSYSRSKRRTEEQRAKAKQDPWGFEHPSGRRSDRDSFWHFFRTSWEASGGGGHEKAQHSFGGSQASSGSSSRHAYEETFAYTPPNAQDQVAKAHLGVLGVDMAGSGSMTSERLRKAYLKCVVLWHPDKHTGNERTRALAEEKFKQAQTSYAFLQQHYSL